MNDDIVIKVQDIGKRYRIGTMPKAYDMLRDRLGEMFKRRISGGSKEEQRTIWALKDVSFEMKRGEVLGIIGRNGAGKTTLLKILSRITTPTEGRAEIRGRVGSLLEVGTGFHPELTGRENVFLNGAILGMTRAEIMSKFDEIVDFSGIEKFIDTPVKRYSSGMYVRLAFAVAAHLEPEILVVDEVLAVGDADFQKKCLGKMDEVARGGRTLLYVSHNMASILALCEKTILLDGGCVVCVAPTNEAIRRYYSIMDAHFPRPLKTRNDREGSGKVRIVGCELRNESAGVQTNNFILGDEASIKLTLQVHERMKVFIGLQVKDEWGRLLFAFHSRERGFTPILERGETQLILHIPRLPFLEGTYRLDFGIVRADDRELLDKIEGISKFEMNPKDFYNSGIPFRRQHGIVLVDHQWIDPQHEPRTPR